MQIVSRAFIEIKINLDVIVADSRHTVTSAGFGFGLNLGNCGAGRFSTQDLFLATELGEPQSLQNELSTGGRELDASDLQSASLKHYALRSVHFNAANTRRLRMAAAGKFASIAFKNWI